MSYTFSRRKNPSTGQLFRRCVCSFLSVDLNIDSFFVHMLLLDSICNQSFIHPRSAILRPKRFVFYHSLLSRFLCSPVHSETRAGWACGDVCVIVFPGFTCCVSYRARSSCRWPAPAGTYANTARSALAGGRRFC